MKDLSEKKRWTKADREKIVRFLKERKTDKRKKSLDDPIPLTEMVIIIHGSKCYQFYNEPLEYLEEDKPIPTFRDLLKHINYDFECDSPVKMLFESYLSGIIYEYGNNVCGDEKDYVWYNGDLIGFA